MFPKIEPEDQVGQMLEAQILAWIICWSVEMEIQATWTLFILNYLNNNKL